MKAADCSSVLASHTPLFCMFYFQARYFEIKSGREESRGGNGSFNCVVNWHASLKLIAWVLGYALIALQISQTNTWVEYENIQFA